MVERSEILINFWLTEAHPSAHPATASHTSTAHAASTHAAASHTSTTHAASTHPAPGIEADDVG
jgi:hypothetical protein